MILLRNAFAVLAALLAMAGAPASAQIDFSGEWRALVHEDAPHRGPGPELGDYTGMPIRDELRVKADTWDASIQTLPEMQCIPHPAAYSERGASMSQMRWWKEIDPVTQNTIAYRKRGGWMEPERTIWMDGRPHPPDYAPHTWQGFSTGRWEGTALVVTTTHLKEGFIQRNGLAHSDRTTMTESIVRHGSYLTANLYVDDPVWLAEPLVRTSTWVLDDTLGPSLQQRYPCSPNEIVVEVPRAKGEVPHHLPATNDMLRQFAAARGLPFDATRGGAETIYPEYMQQIRTMKPEPLPAPRAAAR